MKAKFQPAYRTLGHSRDDRTVCDYCQDESVKVIEVTEGSPESVCETHFKVLVDQMPDWRSELRQIDFCEGCGRLDAVRRAVYKLECADGPTSLLCSNCGV